ncbi:phosphatidate cytidylyltransferase [Marinovum sp. 2_MG-2023]|uniref:phosphatidate cytidylyltransferase n=1 Tax=unclassified Marinovum TaxID=2647166 RepID=UPI0026E2B549|nr:MULTISPECIES: phosphatidate cytidylyltransferase [unclassified Marinovum]MDO6732221.1 phosphatidate cytidylyltransferase [Marinovum sp. 2_MG-2023]MDO6781559.1 phosphatidate cytidylyltransferase [Marinovum sp. 1_MG-2023]
MARKGGNWDDLIVRIGSAIVMVLVGVLAIVLGGWWFRGLMIVVCGAMVWELIRMIGGAQRVALAVGGLSGACLLLADITQTAASFGLMILPSLIGLFLIAAHRGIFLLFSLAIPLAAYAMLALRGDFGLSWLLWLVLVVVVTDVAGYFAGRLLGGPKFWPKVSPKKTWSGTAAGWIGAGAVGMIYWLSGASGPSVIAISMAVSLASQLGDIAESAVKRRVGVKDSSGLIPGHGGVLDRFDGMLGAALFVCLIVQIADFPPVGMP